MPTPPITSRPRFALLVLLVGVALASGCTATRTTERGATARGEVLVDGVSVLGAWQADEVIGDARATRRLQDGSEERVLVVHSGGRVYVVRADHRSGSREVYHGRITGNRLMLSDAAEAGAMRRETGTLLMSGRRLLVRDAVGQTMAYARGAEHRALPLLASGAPQGAR